MAYRAVTIPFFFLLFLCFSFSALAEEKHALEKEISSFLTRLFQARTQLLIHNTPTVLDKFYRVEEKTSRYALQHERRRAQYIHTWAEKRGLLFTDASQSIRIARIQAQKDAATISLVHTLKLTYVYPDKESKPQSFGVGTRHSIKLKKINGTWYVAKEWYSDPIEENPNTIPSHFVQPVLHHTDLVSKKQQKTSSSKKKFNREKAVNYANKYAGAAWGAGNNHGYNPKYRDYHYEGGDCTNFASQVLGDPEEGGGLPMRGGWYYRYKRGGSTTWVQTDAFKHFLIRSGYGRVVAKGTYADIVKPSPSHPQGALARLQPGDLIGYELKGDIDHFSIVVGRDDNGYLLVNSHTGDRYRVPWDLGWDQYTTFILIHIKD
ncbi:amidase domain-containing protein [Aneurinibacillus sp. REN35]|uniref:amidase domain-containing protein n=1 Tax=Aneurinibacillus sp. REN35 TaxID=3237286 RepID=UPI0035290644